jgi:hypothetical protein
MPKSKILVAVEGFSEGPFLRGIRRIVGAENIFKICIGDYRVLYPGWPRILYSNRQKNEKRILEKLKEFEEEDKVNVSAFSNSKGLWRNIFPRIST